VVLTAVVCASTSSPVEQLSSDNTCLVSASGTLLPQMSSFHSTDAVAAQCGSSVTSVAVLGSGENIPTAELNGCPVNQSGNEKVSTGGDARSNRLRSKQQHPSTTRVRRTQLKMLADNLSEFYAPTAGGKRRELLAQKRSVMLAQRSARERQLEVICKQVSLVEKRKKAELEMAAAASCHCDVTEPTQRSVRKGDAVSSNSAANQKTARAWFNAGFGRKLNRWKTKRGRFTVHCKRKSSLKSTERRPAVASSISESMLFEFSLT